MKTKAYEQNLWKLAVMAVLALAASGASMLVDVNVSNARLFHTP